MSGPAVAAAATAAVCTRCRFETIAAQLISPRSFEERKQKRKEAERQRKQEEQARRREEVRFICLPDRPTLRRVASSGMLPMARQGAPK